MKTGKIEPHGIPLPGHLGVFEIVGDRERNVPYLRPGLSRGHYGPLEWFALTFDEQGEMVGGPKELPFPPPLPGTIVVGTDSSLYGCMPDGERYSQHHKKGRAKSGIKPRCQLVATMQCGARRSSVGQICNLPAAGSYPPPADCKSAPQTWLRPKPAWGTRDEHSRTRYSLSRSRRMS